MVHLEFLVCKPMDNSRTINYILPGYLSPGVEAFQGLIELLQGEVVFVKYPEVWDSAEYAERIEEVFLARLISSYKYGVVSSIKKVNLIGLSLGANVAYQVAEIFTVRQRMGMLCYERLQIGVIAIFPVITAKCLRPEVYWQVKILVKLTRMLMRGPKRLRRRVWFDTDGKPRTLFRAYGKPRTWLEVLSGAEEILAADAPSLTSEVKVEIITAGRDQYLDEWRVRRECRAEKVQFINIPEARHCWSVGLFDHNRNELNQLSIKLIAKMI